MADPITMDADLYFFDQPRASIPRRSKKQAEELPQSLRYSNLPPKSSMNLTHKDSRTSMKSIDICDSPDSPGIDKKSLLPELTQSFHNVRTRLNLTMENDEDSQRFLLEEARQSSFSILTQLSLYLYRYEKIKSCIPKSLEYQLMWTSTELTSDVVITQRVWQLVESKESYVKHVQEMAALAASQAEEFDKASNCSSDEHDSISARARKRTNAAKPSLPGITEMGPTPVDFDARSITSNRGDMKVKTKLLRANIKKHGGSNDSRSSARGPGSIRSVAMSRRGTYFDAGLSSISDSSFDMRSVIGQPSNTRDGTTIQFQLSSKACEDKGWLTGSATEKPNLHMVLEWALTILKSATKAKELQHELNVQSGCDQPPVVQYYSTGKKEDIRKPKGKTKPTISLSGTELEDKMPTIPPMYVNDEGKKLLTVSTTDTSTTVYYPSGRPAIVRSHSGPGRHGIYTLVYEDNIDTKLLGCFTPNGIGACYHSNGNIRFVATDTGGTVSKPDGSLLRKWKWPSSPDLKMSTPIQLQLNIHVIYRCGNQNQQSLVFTCQKEMVRFGLGPVVPTEPTKAKPHADQEHLLTNLTFSSQAAAELHAAGSTMKKNAK